MTFRVGQKVVCIQDGWPAYPDVSWPSKDGIYTIREILEQGREPSLRVFEIHNPLIAFSNMTMPIEPAFVLWAFRPLVEGKTDISVFTKMLTGKRVDA